MPSLAELFEAEAPSFTESLEVKRALAHPWCWPPEPAAARVAERYGLRSPAPPPVGETLLVSYAAGLSELWRVTTTPSTRTVPLVGTIADRAVRLAMLAARYAPLVISAKILRHPEHWRAERIWKQGPGASRMLEGESFGLALSLAMTSLLARLPCPVSIAASAQVLDDGRLGRVDGLEHKIALLAGNAPAVRALYVAGEQLDEARRIAAERIAVIGAAHIEEVLAAAFAVPPEAWRNTDAAQQAAEDAFRLCWTDAPLPGWQGVATAAELLAASLPQGSEWARKASFAARVARRHEGGSSFRIADDDLRFLGPELEKQGRAHALQSATDDGADDLAARIESTLVRVGEPHTEPDLRLLGAAGRALAALRRYDEALAYLERSADGWFAHVRRHDASRPICEAMRVAGATCRPDAFRRLIERARHCARDEQTSDISRAFLRLAEGRAHVQLGSPTEALVALDDEFIHWSDAPEHVQHARLRWRARALDDLGRRAEADEVRAALEEDDGHTALLAALDKARRDGGDVRQILDHLAARRPQAMHWLLADDDGADDAERARRVAEECPY